MNSSAVVVLALSGAVHWKSAGIIAVGSVAGGLTGNWLLSRLPAKVLRAAIISIGAALTLWLFVRR